MLHLLKLFSQDIVKYSAVLILGLFSIIYIIENGAVIENIEKYQYLFLACGLGIFILRFIYFMKYHRFIILPYSLSLYNRVADEQKESKIFLDKFKRFDKRNQTIYFKNRLAIDKQAYLDLKDKIIHLLGYEDKNEVEFEIKAHNKKEIAIRLFKLPNKFDWHIELLKDKHIYLGHSKNGGYFLPLGNLGLIKKNGV
jgi:hypothetical protein